LCAIFALRRQYIPFFPKYRCKIKIYEFQKLQHVSIYSADKKNLYNAALPYSLAVLLTTLLSTHHLAMHLAFPFGENQNNKIIRPGIPIQYASRGSKLAGCKLSCVLWLEITGKMCGDSSSFSLFLLN